MRRAEGLVDWIGEGRGKGVVDSPSKVVAILVARRDERRSRDAAEAKVEAR